MVLPHLTAKKPAAPSTQRWWLSLYPRLSTAGKRSLLILSLAAALLVTTEWQIMNRPSSAAPSLSTTPNSLYALPAVQHALHQLDLLSRDPIGPQFQVNTYTT